MRQNRKSELCRVSPVNSGSVRSHVPKCHSSVPLEMVLLGVYNIICQFRIELCNYLVKNNEVSLETNC